MDNRYYTDTFDRIVEEQLESIRQEREDYENKFELKELVLKRNNDSMYNKRIEDIISKAYIDPNTLYIETKQNGYTVIVYQSKK